MTEESAPQSPESSASSADESPEDSGRSWVPPALFAATLVSTFMVGMSMSPTRSRLRGVTNLLGFDLGGQFPAWWEVPAIWLEAGSFSLSLLGILLAHEMGHFLTARRYGVDVSPPYFIPATYPFGTLGAFIRMRVDRIPGRHLMRIAAFGPFAGMVIAVPVLIIGLFLSEVQAIPEDFAGWHLGSCMLMRALELMIHPDVPAGHDIMLHPMAFAGWAGCFVTGFNLIPVSQLDGGHVLYGLLGDRANRVMPVLWVGLLVLGLTVFPSWLMLAALIAFVLGIRHPPMISDGPVVGTDRLIGVAALVLFVLTFIPAPFAAEDTFPTVLDLLRGDG